MCAVVTAIAWSCGDPESAQPEISPEEAIARGRDLYEHYGCGVCHGRGGRGNGPVAVHLNPAPRDLRNPDTYRNGASAASVERTIEKGIVEKGRGMPGYPHIPASERRLIARYIVSLQES